MTGPLRDGCELRVLILTPTGKDAALTRAILEKAGMASVICADIECLCREAAEGAGSLLVAEEALTTEARRTLAELLASQPPWSDLPVLLVTRQGANSPTVTAVQEALGNVTLLERPLRIATLVSTIRVALRARVRQYELRERVEPQELLAAIVASSEDAIISKTLDGTIRSWNAGAERMFGYSAAEAVGQSILLIMPPDRQDEEREILERLRRGERVETFSTVRIAKDGRRIDISLTISPIRDAANRIVGASKVARDISAQKRAELALLEADRRKDEFLATLAHELRNPLAPIRNSLDILRMSERPDPTFERVREMMERQVTHMVRLVDDLMEVSRITRGKIELRKERVELAAVLASAVETSQPLIEASEQRLALDIPAEPLKLDADPVRLAQVFSNLLNNAAKYTPKGGRIWLSARADDGMAVVSVRDTGIGIPAETLPRVFDLFMQADGSHRRSRGGLGIGLTLVRSLVQQHGGSVTARSDGLGRGSEFVVRLDLADAAPLEAARPDVEPHAVVPLRVMVVDDNRDAADSVALLVKRLGAEVRIVHDGPAALDALEAFEPALVLLDVAMPGMDGYEVARAIREIPRFRNVTLVALTGWGQEEDRRRSQAAGFNSHLVKPADIETLEALMVSVKNPGERRPIP